MGETYVESVAQPSAGSGSELLPPWEGRKALAHSCLALNVGLADGVALLAS